MSFSPRARTWQSLNFSAFAGTGDTYALGQAKVPYRPEIEKIIRGFPPCFTAKSIIPILEKSQNFARSVSTEGLSRFSGSASPESFKKELDAAWWRLDFWKKRFQAEGDKRYCNWLPETKNDHFQVVQSIVLPYQIASGIAAATGVVDQASKQLEQDLKQGALTLGGILPDWLNIKVLGAVALGILGLGLYKRVRGSGAAADEEEEPEPAPRPKKSDCPPCPPCDTGSSSTTTQR